MNARALALKQLLRDSLYVVDEPAVANAIVMRAVMRRTIPDVALRSEAPEPLVRSFRVHAGRGSFRLMPSGRRAAH